VDATIVLGEYDISKQWRSFVAVGSRACVDQGLCMGHGWGRKNKLKPSSLGRAEMLRIRANGIRDVTTASEAN